jgi:hypothetical protein
MQPEAVARLEHKNVQEAIIARIGEDLRLTPFLAQAYFQQMISYFEQYAGLDLQDNQLAYCAIGAEEPPGRKLAECHRVSVCLTLHDPADFDTAGHSLSALRQARIIRLCAQAHDQGGLLTQEDLAILLTTSHSTIKRDLRALRKRGVFVPTRGQQRDIGPGISHKVEIIRRYLGGEALGDISRAMSHGVDSMQRYLQAFRQVALMTREGLDAALIRKASRQSLKLIGEYQALFQQALDTPDMHARLHDLLGDRTPAAKGGRRR